MVLKEFCVQVLDCCFNPMMKVVKVGKMFMLCVSLCMHMCVCACVHKRVFICMFVCVNLWVLKYFN